MKNILKVIILVLSGLLIGEELQVYSGDIIRLDDFEARDAMTCPDLVDSCVYVCSDGNSCT